LGAQNHRTGNVPQCVNRGRVSAGRFHEVEQVADFSELAGAAIVSEVASGGTVFGPNLVLCLANLNLANQNHS
jgi:hypothetical protein